jgi:hypothetical protein
MVTPPIFCAGYRANKRTTASAHLPSKYPSCGGVTQDFAKSFSGQHGQPKYLSKRTVNIGKPTKELNGMSQTILGMRHNFGRRPTDREAHQCPLLAQSRHRWLQRTCPLLGVKRTCLFALHMSAFDPKRTSRAFPSSAFTGYDSLAKGPKPETKREVESRCTLSPPSW